MAVAGVHMDWVDPTKDNSLCPAQLIATKFESFHTAPDNSDKTKSQGPGMKIYTS